MGTCKGVQGDGNSELWDTLRDSLPSPQLHLCALRGYYFCVVLRGGPGVHAGRAVICELPRWGLTTVLRPRPWAHRGAGKTAVLGSFFRPSVPYSGIAVQVWRGLPGGEEGHETYDIAMISSLWWGFSGGVVEVAIVVEVVVVKIAMGGTRGCENTN